MRPLRIVLTVVALAAASGCHRVAYQSRLPAGGERHQRQLNYFLLGIIGDHEVDLDALCPEGVARYHTDATAFGLFNVFTLGIFTPRTLVVECTGAGKRP